MSHVTWENTIHERDAQLYKLTRDDDERYLKIIPIL